MTAYRVPLGMLLIATLMLGACGKKGAPLPPLQRIPASPGGLTVTRVENDVYAQFTVPTVNIDGVGPADVARVELYAITADRPPEGIDPEDLRELSTQVGAEQVRRPMPPPPPPKEGMPPIPMPPPAPGVDQGAPIVIRDTLAPEAMTPVALPEPEGPRGARIEPDDVPRALVAPSDASAPKRYYYVVAVSSRGRHGPPSHLAPVPLGLTSSAPPAPKITVDEKTTTVRWTPPADARGVMEPPAEGLLPSRPIVAGPPPTTYDVYEIKKDPPSANASPTMPTPLTPAPVGALEFTQPTALGVERCFVVRPVDIVDGLHVRGPASPVVCATFADTFAPAPPGRLDIAATSGRISLIWEPSPTADVAGYIVLRGEGPDATLSPLNTTPTTETTYTDDKVKPGVRYTYAVVAVDKSGNRSGESNRQEETARQ